VLFVHFTHLWSVRWRQAFEPFLRLRELVDVTLVGEYWIKIQVLADQWGRQVLDKQIKVQSGVNIKEQPHAQAKGLTHTSN
jgi:hypothetical protein